MTPGRVFKGRAVITRTSLSLPGLMHLPSVTIPSVWNSVDVSEGGPILDGIRCATRR